MVKLYWRSDVTWVEQNSPLVSDDTFDDYFGLNLIHLTLTDFFGDEPEAKQIAASPGAILGTFGLNGRAELTEAANEIGFRPTGQDPVYWGATTDIGYIGLLPDPDFDALKDAAPQHLTTDVYGDRVSFGFKAGGSLDWSLPSHYWWVSEGPDTDKVIEKINAEARLFTNGNDTVDFDNLTTEQLAAILNSFSTTESFGGNDDVTFPKNVEDQSFVDIAIPGNSESPTIRFQISRPFEAGPGNDTINASAITGLVPVTIYGEDGNDILTGGQAGDFLYGGKGNDALVSKGQLNNFFATGTMYGDEGNDHFWGIGDGSPGKNIIHGGDGADTVHYDKSQSFYDISVHKFDLFLDDSDQRPIKVSLSDDNFDEVMKDVEFFQFAGHTTNATQLQTAAAINAVFDGLSYMFTFVAGPAGAIGGIAIQILKLQFNALTSGATAKDAFVGTITGLVKFGSGKLLDDLLSSNGQGELAKKFLGDKIDSYIDNDLRRDLSDFFDSIVANPNAQTVYFNPDGTYTQQFLNELRSTIGESIEKIQLEIRNNEINIDEERPSDNPSPNDFLDQDSIPNLVLATSGSTSVDGDNNSNVIIGDETITVVAAGDGNDFVFTGDGNQTINGEGGNDRIFSGPGNDNATLNGGEGNDYLDGGEGEDAAEYQGLSSDFTVIKNDDGSFTVIDNNDIDGLDEGIDLLKNIEIVKFLGDGVTIDLSTFDPGEENIPPEAFDDTVTTDEDNATSIAVLSNDSDADNDALSITKVNGADVTAGSTLVLASGAMATLNADGTFAYDPNGQFESLSDGDSATDSFTYTIDDGNGGESTATVTVTINGVTDVSGNNNPVAADDSITTIENSATSGNVLDNDDDPDGDNLSVIAANGSSSNINQMITLLSGALLLLNADGTFSYDPNGAFDDLNDGDSGIDSFTYTISDGNDGEATATANVVVNGAGTDDDNADPPSGLSIGIYNAESDTLITQLNDGDVIDKDDIGQGPVTIAAYVPDNFALAVESMRLNLNDGMATRVENVNPYALFGDINEDFFGVASPFIIGDNSIDFELYAQDGASGDPLDTVSVDFTVTEDMDGSDEEISAEDVVVGLYDADDDVLIKELSDGAQILASDVAGRSVTLAASVSGDSALAGLVESMSLDFNNGAFTRTENVEPYALFGDIVPDFFGQPHIFEPGSNSLELALYAEDQLAGNALGSVNFDFIYVDEIV